MLKIILNRLKPQVEKIIAEEQAGFRAGRSATKQILNLHILCEKYFQHQQDLYHVFKDSKKATSAVLFNSSIGDCCDKAVKGSYCISQPGGPVLV